VSGTYRTRDDGYLIDGRCRFLLEQFLDDEATDIAGAYDCEPPEVRHDMDRWMDDEDVSRAQSWSGPKGGYLSIEG
jgi:hypothetical protein